MVVTLVFDLCVFSVLCMSIFLCTVSIGLFYFTHTKLKERKKAMRFVPGKRCKGSKEHCLGPTPSADTHTAWGCLGQDTVGCRQPVGDSSL